MHSGFLESETTGPIRAHGLRIVSGGRDAGKNILPGFTTQRQTGPPERVARAPRYFLTAGGPKRKRRASPLAMLSPVTHRAGERNRAPAVPASSRHREDVNMASVSERFAVNKSC
ncbi:hypothetical protein C4K12_2434 [Pseudomonas chlororaphis subsp. aureofaciens]|nr:hypothetical protein C4K12_2434 [Pseudomonas chlororaphis subsp. aureofaciens]AZE35445.1 hypothetical protein C4K06_2412 [Pseudomonas chlororaphis subsp. aureofaciens]